MSDGCYRSDNEVEGQPTIHERYNRMWERASVAENKLSQVKLALQEGIADMRAAHEAALKRFNDEVLVATGVGGARLQRALDKLSK